MTDRNRTTLRLALIRQAIMAKSATVQPCQKRCSPNVMIHARNILPFAPCRGAVADLEQLMHDHPVNGARQALLVA